MGSDDDEALRWAVEASLALSKLPRATSPAPAVSISRAATEALADEPIELCCPLSLVLFVDPVQTIRGMTYERAFIRKWFADHQTDPMTGESLPTTEVYDDCDML